MKDVLYFWLDLAEYLAVGALFAYLLKGRLSARFYGEWRMGGAGAWVSRVRPEWIMCLQYAAVRQTLSHARLVKRFIYGKDMFLASSRQSIWPVAASMACALLFGMILYKGSRMWLLSLVTAFYAFMELSRFALYPLAVTGMDVVMEYCNRLFWEEGAISQESYMRFLGICEAAFNVVLSTLVTLLLFLCVRGYKRALPGEGNASKPQQAAILFVPELIGLLYAAMLRCILFYYNGEVHNLMDRYPELKLMIPALSILCAGSILLSAVLTGREEREHEKRLLAEVSRSRAGELEEHVKDMESLYLQIRGMKHDMRHYIADIRALLAQMASGDKQAGEEARRYMDSMQASLDLPDLKYQTGNAVTNVIVGRYARLAERRGVTFSCEFLYPSRLGIDAFDIGTILNNGLSNAFEACEKTEGARIALRADCRGNMFFITVENDFTGPLDWEGGFPISAKAGDGHGLGLKNIASCAEKYYGKARCRATDGTFCLTVMLQGRPSGKQPPR